MSYDPNCYEPARREGGSKLCFCPSVRPSVCLSVCLSVCPSVAYIANNSRTRRPSEPKFGMNVPHLWCDSHTSFKIKGQGHTGPIDSDTHRAPYLPNGKAYELQTCYTDGGRRPASATGAINSNVKVARSRDLSQPSWPNAVPVSLAAGGGIACRPNPAATLLVNRKFVISTSLHFQITAIYCMREYIARYGGTLLTPSCQRHTPYGQNSIARFLCDSMFLLLAGTCCHAARCTL